MKMIEKESEMAVNKQCSILTINRSSLYYKKVIKEENIDIKSKILDIYENKPFYGYRRVEKELKNKGYEIGKKKVIKLRQELKIKTIYPKKKTTIIRKEDKKYPYLLLGLEINQPNTVWSIDITYIKVEGSYCYLAAIIDWYSRKILSYRISNTMEVDFCIEALEEALKKYGKPDVFNSDQGSQFTSEKFTKKLNENKIKISMDGKGRWADNVIIERFFRTLKYENIFLKRYENMLELKKGVKEFISFYNNDRLHSSLNYETPDSVYFEENKSKIKPIYKMDKESLVKCLFWMFIYNKNSGKKTVDKTAA
jgi:putative transposase